MGSPVERLLRQAWRSTWAKVRKAATSVGEDLQKRAEAELEKGRASERMRSEREAQRREG